MGFFLPLSSVVTAHPTPPLSVTLIFALILLGMVLCLALEEKLRCKKSVITGVTAVVVLPLADYFHLLPLRPLENSFHERVRLPLFISGVDWEVITIILGTTLFVEVASRSGLFSWIAISLTKFSRGDPFVLLIWYGVLTVLFSAFLNNVTAIIIVGSLTAVSLNRLGSKDKLLGFLLIEGLLTNVGGLVTLISSVPNVIAGNLAGIAFVEFMMVATPYVAVTTFLTILFGARLFKIDRLASLEDKKQAVRRVSSFDETDGIGSQWFFYGSAVAFLLLIVLFASAAYLPVLKDLGLGYIAVSAALLMLLVYRNEVGKFYSAVDWDLIGFFVFLFVVVNVMEHAGVLALIGKGIAQLIAVGDVGGKLLLLAASAFVSCVTDNISLTAVLAKSLAGFSPPTPSDSPLWWAVIFGANLGGNLTPIGSASTFVAVAIMHKHGLKLSFFSFVKLAFPFAALHIILALGYLLLL